MGEALGELLKKNIFQALQHLHLEPIGDIVNVILPCNSADPPVLSGAWKTSSGRLSQTQQAMQVAGFTCACQLELSSALRRVLAMQKDVREAFADSIWIAFLQWNLDSASFQKRSAYERGPEC